MSEPLSMSPKYWLRRSAMWGGLIILSVFLLVRCGPHFGSANKSHSEHDRPIAVVAAAATRGDLPVFIDALGTATPSNSVLVRSRVDGQLMRIHFNEGQTVKAGDLLAEIDPRPFQVQLQQAEGQLARDAALLRNAHTDLDRYQALWQQDSISRQELDTQHSLVGQYEGAVLTDKANIADAKLQLAYADVRAPIAGRVGLRQVDAGNMVHASDSTGLVLITQEQPIAVVFTIPEAQLGPVLKQFGQSHKPVPVESWDRLRGEKIADGKLLSIDNQIDTSTGTVKLKAEFANTNGVLFPNQFVNVRMHVDTIRSATMIPANAVQRGSQGVFVYTVNADKTVKLQLIELGLSSGDSVIVTKGLQPGMQVVVDGVDNLRDGANIELIDRRADNAAAPITKSMPAADNADAKAAPKPAKAT